MDLKNLEEAVKSSRSAMDEAVRELGDESAITWDCALCYMDACNALKMARRRLATDATAGAGVPRRARLAAHTVLKPRAQGGS